MNQTFRFRARTMGVLSLTLSALTFIGGRPLLAQAPTAPAAPTASAPAPPPPPDRGPRGGMRMHMGPPGRWWDNPDVAQKLGLSTDQQKKMDDIFQQSRLKLIDDHAAVEKQEAILEPLMSADQPDEKSVLAQVDKVAQARAELEKANARMLIELRRQLTPQQWKTLQTLEPRERHGDFDRDRPTFRPGRGGSDGKGPGGPPPPPGGPGL